MSGGEFNYAQREIKAIASILKEKDVKQAIKYLDLRAKTLRKGYYNSCEN